MNKQIIHCNRNKNKRAQKQQNYKTYYPKRYPKACSFCVFFNHFHTIFTKYILKNNTTTTLTKPQIIVNNFLDSCNIKYNNEEPFVYYSVDNYFFVSYNYVTTRGLYIKIHKNHTVTFHTEWVRHLLYSVMRIPVKCMV